MIIVKICGGLGNQMFQTAAGFALSKYFKTEFKIDLTFLNHNNTSTKNFTARKLAIDVFGIDFKIANSNDLELFLKRSNALNFLGIKSKFLQTSVVEDSWNPDQFFEIITKNSYLDGFWQSEDYFKSYKIEILELFRFPDIPSAQLETYERIKKLNSVSLHFRRGDYISSDYIRSIHNVCDLEYYSKAINYLFAKQSDIRLFLFSDEPEWLYENFKSDIDYEIISTRSDILDMHLMSLCKHNIIANSSFSWWGAWLNKNPEKIVIAPQKWFATDIVNYEKVVPESWIKV